MKKLVMLALASAIFATPAAANEALTAAVKADYDSYLSPLFLHFHRNPELSYVETETAKRMAAELQKAGAQVTTGVGGTGVVGVMRNGAGPTVLLRADMDGLPVKEDSGLSYASTVSQKGHDGQVYPVMHACGHDTHITALVGAARRLAAMKDQWKGTIVFVVQPAEERIGGARKMMKDGLYTRFPKPDYALAFHVDADTPTGKMIVQPGLIYSSADTVDIIVHGVGAHGASPHRGKDPIVMGSEIVMVLQTLVSRELAPLSPGVVTVGAFNSGMKHNIISDEARLQLTVRSNDRAVRDQLIAGIKRIATNVGRMNGLPEDKLPTVIVSDEQAPPTINDAGLSQSIGAAFRRDFGTEVIIPYVQTDMGAEDFPAFVDPSTGVKGLYFMVGGTPQAAFDSAKAGGPPVPSHHSPFFKIDPEPSITLGTRAMVTAALELLPAR
ncbi:MAG: amidohydrolase [Sphingomonas sp.]|nr:amidohydrolase [Sphingomonas sp.]